MDNEYTPWVVPLEGVQGIYENITHPLQAAIMQIENTGIIVDKARLLELAVDYGKRIEDKEEEFYLAAEEEVAFSSTKKLGDFLYGKLKLPVIVKTKKGAPSTGLPALEKLASYHPCVQALYDLKKLVKLKKDFLDGLPDGKSKGLLPFIQRDGRIHSTYRVDGTDSGRLSSAGPNLQNIAKVKDIRGMFKPAPGNLLIECDYSQLELRLAAFLSGDEGMIAAFASGADFHTATAAMMFSCATSDVTSEQRRLAKTINFGILYGMGAYTLALRLGIKEKEADEYIKQWFGAYPKVKQWLLQNLRFASKNGYVDTPVGRRRHLPELANPSPFTDDAQKRKARLERIANNFQIQSTGSDILSLATISLIEYPFDEFVATGAKPVMSLHDALYWEVPEENAAEAAFMIKDAMEAVPREILGDHWILPAEATIGAYWGDVQATLAA